MTSTTITWESETVPIAGAALHVARAGAGAPLLVLHHDVGSLERLPFYDALARRFTVIVPSHPGYDGAEPPTSTLEQWDLNREMTFRIAWKPYMYNPTLGRLLGSVATPALVVWGREDGIVPLECGERYQKALAHARLEVLDGAGHFVELEKPDELAQLVTRFVTEA